MIRIGYAPGAGDLRFNVFFKGDDWQGTEKGMRLQSQFADVGVEVAYLSYTQTTSSSRLRLTLQNIDDLAKGHVLRNAVRAACGLNRESGGRRQFAI